MRSAGASDFASRQVGKAIPYRIYDVAANTGRATVGTDHDTAAFGDLASAAGGTPAADTTTRTPRDC